MTPNAASPAPAAAPPSLDPLRAALATAERLHPILEQETRLVRLGRYREAVPLALEKEALVADYLAAIRRLAAEREALRVEHPELLADLGAAHARLGEAVQSNLRVLATAKSISESLLHEVATAVTRQDVPLAYAEQGALVTVTRSTNRPIALSMKT